MSFNFDIKWHKDHLLAYKAADKISELISNGADVNKHLSLSIDEIDIGEDNLVTLVHNTYDYDKDCIKVNNYIKSLVKGRWKKGIDGHKQFLVSNNRYTFENILWKFRIQSWGSDSCEIEWKEEKEEIPIDNDRGYELHNIDGKDTIVKTRQVIKGIKCPKGFSLTDNFFKYKKGESNG